MIQILRETMKRTLRQITKETLQKATLERILQMAQGTPGCRLSEAT